MKKVLYIGGFIMPDGNAAAQRVLGIAKTLRVCGCEVRFCGLNHSGNNIEGEIDDFQFINFPYPSNPLNWLSYLTGRDYACDEILNYQPDIVILYNHPALAIEHIVKICHRRGIKTVADVTEWYEARGNIIFKIIKSWDVKRRMNVSHRKVDGLICVSRFLKEFYNDIEGLPVVEVPPLIDKEQLKWHQKPMGKAEGVKLVYAGSPGCSKDRLDLVLNTIDDIMSELNRPISFDIIGVSHSQYMKIWKDNKEYAFANFLGRIPHKEVIRRLLGADFQIFLRPDNLMNKAGFPTKYVETVSSGTLPITNLSSNLSEYISDGINGFIVRSLSHEDIKVTVRDAINTSRDKISGMKKNLYRNIFDYHNYIQSIKNFIEVL